MSHNSNNQQQKQQQQQQQQQIFDIEHLLQLDTLEKELREAADIVQEWALERQTAKRSLEANHKGQMKQSELFYKKLVEREHELSKEAKELAEEMEQREKQLKQMEEEAMQARELAEGLPEQLEHLRVTVNEERETIEEVASTIEGAESKQTSQLKSLEEANYAFKSRLGLSFERRSEDDDLRFVFTLIDRFDMDREFSFNIKLDDSGRYVLVDCEPPVRDAQKFMRECNQSGGRELSKFVRRMRRAFVDLCEKGN
jgi:seryl-tRNA synthetase